MRGKHECQGKSKMVNARPHSGLLPSVFAALRRDRAEAKGEGGQEKENRPPRFRNVVRRRLQERRRATRRWTTAVPSPPVPRPRERERVSGGRVRAVGRKHFDAGGSE